MSASDPAGHPSDDTPTAGRPTSSPQGSPCAAAPGSAGPVAGLVVVTTTASATAAGGSSLAVRTEITVLSDGPRIVAHPRTSALEVLRAGVVVARTTGAAGPDVPLALDRGRTLPAQTVPAAVPLVGCDGSALPRGLYRLRALVGYGGDPLNNADGGATGAFVLASEPVDLTVT